MLIQNAKAFINGRFQEKTDLLIRDGRISAIGTGLAAEGEELLDLGGDLLLTVTGGAAHVGCVVLATHRQSLTGSGADSADSSVLNRSGHKDEFLLRALAERLSAVAGCAVAAVGGVHYDGLDQQGLRSAAHIEQQALAQAEDWAAELLP